MQTSEMKQKERDMEAFNNVVALYTDLKNTSLRVKQATIKADELEAQPIDFVIDVELKAKRLLGEPIYNLFLRAVFNENLDLLPESTREALGENWISYGLGPDGTYRKLYFRIKNEQIRSFLIKKFDRSTGLEQNAI